MDGLRWEISPVMNYPVNLSQKPDDNSLFSCATYSDLGSVKKENTEIRDSSILGASPSSSLYFNALLCNPFYNKPGEEGRDIFLNASSSAVDQRKLRAREFSIEKKIDAMVQMKEMIYRAAAMRPISAGTLKPVAKPKWKNVRISNDPQTVAARQRRERISEKLRILRSLVPGGSRMDTASMLDEAANYLKFLKSQINILENQEQGGSYMGSANPSQSFVGFSSPFVEFPSTMPIGAPGLSQFLL